MKWQWDIGKRSQLARGGRILGGVAFAVIAAGLLFAKVEPAWLSWTLFGICLAGLLIVSFWRSREKEENKEEDLIDMARQAIRAESDRLDAKRADLDKVLTAYGEWMEFPDFDELQSLDWQSEEHLQFDSRVAELLDAESEQMLARFSDGNYWSDGKFDTMTLLSDVYEFMVSIAKIYKPEAEYPLLETDLESILKAVNRASLQVILLLEELPVLEVQQMNLRKISDGVRTASNLRKKYDKLQPIIEPARYVWQGGKFVVMSNPMVALGWIVGSELVWKGVKKLGAKALNVYLLSLVRQSLGIIAWETAGIYDKTHRFRGPDWTFGVELAHLLSEFEQHPKSLNKAFTALGSLPLRSNYDRLFLYRCVAQHKSPRPQKFAQGEVFSHEVREKLFTQLMEFFSKHVERHIEVDAKTAAKWKEGVVDRLQLGRAERALPEG